MGKYVNLRNERLGIAKRMNSGLMATIIGYRDSHDMDIAFSNGCVVKGVRYDRFNIGQIKCPLIIEQIDDYAKVTNPNTDFCWLMDIEDLPLLDGRLWNNIDGYVARSTNPGTVRLHRLIMNAPDDVEVDHADGNRLDIRKKNLRVATHAENQRNTGKPITNTSGYKGVSWRKANNKWTAYIGVDGKPVWLGYFSNKKDAAMAYNEAAIKYYGEFARLNEI